MVNVLEQTVWETKMSTKNQAPGSSLRKMSKRMGSLSKTLKSKMPKSSFTNADTANSRASKNSRHSIENAGSRLSRASRTSRLPKVLRAISVFSGRVGSRTFSEQLASEFENEAEGINGSFQKGKLSMQVKQRKKRQPAPLLPLGLEELMRAASSGGKDGEFVLWLGDDFTRSLFSGKVPVLSELTRATLFDTLVQEVADEKKKIELTELLGKATDLDLDEQCVDVEKALDRLEVELKAALGEGFYQRALTFELKRRLDASTMDSFGQLVADEMSLRLLRALQPKCIVYTGTNRILEQYFSHDNIPVDSFTLADMKAHGLTLEKLERDPSIPKQMILKLHGDITQPDTLCFKDQRRKLFSQYGISANGDPLVQREMSSSASFFRSFVQELAANYRIIFLGNPLKKGEPISYLLQNLVLDAKEAEFRRAEKEREELTQRILRSNTKRKQTVGPPSTIVHFLEDSIHSEYEMEVLEASPFPTTSWLRKKPIHFSTLDEGNSSYAGVEMKHYALVSVITKREDGSRYDPAELNVEYMTYSPDDTHSQLVEFLGYLETLKSRSTDAVPSFDLIEPHSVIQKGYVIHKYSGYKSFLQELITQEKVATTICFLDNELPKEIAVREYREKWLLPGYRKRFDQLGLSKSEIANLLVVEKERAGLLEKRFLQPEAERDVPSKENIPAKNRKVSYKSTTQITKQTYLLISKQGVESAFKKTGKELAFEVERYQKLLRMIRQDSTKTNRKVCLRVFDPVEDTSLLPPFSLIYTNNDIFTSQRRTPIGDIILQESAETADSLCNVSWLEQNTNLAEEKSLLFNRIWNVSLGPEESVNLVESNLEAILSDK